MNVIMYKPDYNHVYGKKCNKCDDDRYIHFSSPSGMHIPQKQSTRSA